MYKYLPKIVGPRFSSNWQTLQLDFQETLFLIDLHVSNLKSQCCFSQRGFQVVESPIICKIRNLIIS